MDLYVFNRTNEYLDSHELHPNPNAWKVFPPGIPRKVPQDKARNSDTLRRWRRKGYVTVYTFKNSA